LVQPPRAKKVVVKQAIELAAMLLELGAVSVRLDPPYRWASGLLSPIYCDNRLLIGHPAQRRRVQEALLELLASHQWRPGVIAGTATAGIPHAAWLSWLMDLPMVYVRSSEKSHGQGKKIEGVLPDPSTVVVVEDLISTGGSALRSAAALREAGAEVLGVAAIFSYGLPQAQKAFQDQGLSYAALTGLPALRDVLLAKRLLNGEQARELEKWSQDPEAWSVYRTPSRP
jgi:orotate phosphoribosyltransferase